MTVKSFRFDGLTVDIPPAAVPETRWTGVSQVNFRDKVAERRRGYDNTLTDPGSASGITPAFGLYVNQYGATRTPANFIWYGGHVTAGTAAAIGQITTGGAGVDSAVTPAIPAVWAGNAPGIWTGGQLSNFVPYLNCQTEPPVYYDIAAVAWQLLPNLPGGATSTFTALRHFREFLIGMGLDTTGGSYYPDQIYWSDAAPYNAPPATWVAAATNQAGDAVLPGGGEIVDGATLGDAFFVYKRNAVYRLDYIGGNFVLQQRPVFDQFGAWSQNCIVTEAGRQYVFTGSDLIVHDGASYQSLLAGKARDLIDETWTNITAADRKNVFLFLDPIRRELWLHLNVSGTTHPTRAIIVGLDSGEAGLYTHKAAVSGQFNDLSTGTNYLVGRASLKFWRNDNQVVNYTDEDGTAITSVLTREQLDFGLPHQYKIPTWVRPIFDTSAATTVAVEVGYADTPDEAPTWVSYGNFVTGTTDKLDVDGRQGRYLSFRFTSTTAANWKCPGFDVGYELGGTY